MIILPRARRTLVLLGLAGCGGPAAVQPAPQVSPGPPADPTAAQAEPAPAPAPSPPALRLPAGVRPLRYALDLTIDPAQPTFGGRIAIELELAAPTAVVWLDATGLTVEAAHVEAGGRSVPAAVLPGGDDFLGFAPPQPIAAGHATLVVDYRGPLDAERSLGLYRQKEGDDWYVYSFFEPIDARRAFPCFDEPAYKVPWKITFHVPRGQVALANAPTVDEGDEAGGLRRVTTAESRPMPSYLVALVVGPFDVIDAGTVGRAGAKLRFVVPRGRGAETRYAAEVTPRIIALLEDWFAAPYPYEKLDVAVVPRYWGTMEHPGLIALGQPITLIPAGDETFIRRQFYADLAAHELAHYWFGDYVTLAWWNDTWLNEALASWLDVEITARLDPSWRYELRNGEAREKALAADALSTARAIREPVTSRDGIADSFDNGIVYDKGASVVRMFELWVGRPRFQQIVRAYLAAHAWGSVTTEDFEAALAAGGAPDAAEALRTFLEQPGAPLVTAELRCAAGAAPRLELAQRRDLPAGSAGSPDSASRIWSVPICVRWGAGRASAGKDGRACTLLTEATGEIALPAGPCPRWVLLNADGAGYYRAAYDAAGLRALFAPGGPRLSLDERRAAVGDAAAAVARGDLALGDALAVVLRLAADERPVVEASLQLIERARPADLPATLRPGFAAFVRAAYGRRARALGWMPRRGDGPDTRLLRRVLVPLVARAGEDPALRAQARRVADRYVAGAVTVDEDAALLALFEAAAEADQPLFDRILAAARAAKDRNRRGNLLAALGHVRSPELAGAALGVVATGEFDLREAGQVVWLLLRTPETRDLAWDFLVHTFDMVSGSLRSDDLGNLIRDGFDICDPTRRAAFAEFFGERVTHFDGGPQAFAHALERIDLCIAARVRDLPSLERMLVAHRSR